MDSDDKLVHLVIKSPDPNVTDQTIDCTITWTVGKLKDELSKVYSTKPIPEKQKLIYLGRVLQDDSMLKDILRQDETSDIYILHLVCTKSNENCENGCRVLAPTEETQNEDNDGERTNAPREQILSRVNNSRNGDGDVLWHFSCGFNLEWTRRRDRSQPQTTGDSSQPTASTFLLLLLALLVVLLVALASGMLE